MAMWQVRQVSFQEGPRGEQFHMRKVLLKRLVAHGKEPDPGRLATAAAALRCILPSPEI